MKIYNAEKTIADCFKYRNKIGKEIAVEALKTYWRQGKIRINELRRYAKICRIESVMRPYLEALI